MTGRTGRALIAAAAAAVVVAGASSCSNTKWCELDDGDVLVANSYCEAGVPGYEWEPDHDHPKSKRKPDKRAVDVRSSIVQRPASVTKTTTVTPKTTAATAFMPKPQQAGSSTPRR